MRVIETMLQEVAANTQGINHYGRGAKAYSNIESPAYPRLWVHLINPIDIVHINNSVTTSYEIVGEISSKCSFTDDIANDELSAANYLDTLETLQAAYYRFITNLNKDSRNKAAIGSVRRKEFLHEYDDNLCGYVFTFVISINEQINYQCQV